ncbi:hypothetical protein AA310_15760 [Arthrobacter sp. YC-RL1]|uniref:Uncharacterized protein n=1 Tax=Glutamicibacter soli TaxID=453836 RepID=A0A365YH72_9MICC|nr:hypothetical protein AFL94_15645 [Arthrobacter sp. LS16]ALQ29479.1 hypothetical protein ATC04_02295 [Arthrobacter sp. YC-RL1]KLI89140.1 hypothetical protein AA310_15760 [Arthrobacter sp. YC-RL1]RBM01889.1 hypothetical protein C1H84_08620 [Glutamicibacter soli]
MWANTLQAHPNASSGRPINRTMNAPTRGQRTVAKAHHGRGARTGTTTANLGVLKDIKKFLEHNAYLVDA